ncbi:MAG: hypothetical protein KJZ47_09605 [Gemmatimonadales bacterium]|nr:hypothetical protein [Gemmatimonadales bacterium]
MQRLALLLLGSALIPAPGHAQAPSDTIAIREWTVPWERSRPRDPSVDPQGRVWFVGQSGNYVARFDMTTEKFERFEIEPGTNPHTVVIDRTGNAWYTGNRNGRIGRIDARSGEIQIFMMPDSAARDPHTIAFNSTGELWFTLQNSNMVGRLDPATGQTRLVAMETPRSRPYGIVVDKNDIPWYDMFGTNKIGTINPATMEPREITLPWTDARPRRIALTSDGTVWYGDYVRGTLGRLDPATGKVEEFPLPSGRTSLPYAIMSDDQDRIWVVETGVQPNRFVGFDAKTRKVISITPVPGGAGTIRHMEFDPRTGRIWFGTDNNTIGYAQVRPPRLQP